MIPGNAIPIPNSNIYQVTTDGSVYNSRGHILRSYDTNGYRAIKLSLTPGAKRRVYMVHRLVYEAHVGPIPEGYWINHKDGVKWNNTLENLEATTPSDNHLHASHVLKRKYARGAESGRSKLLEEAITAIKMLSDQGQSQYFLAKAFGVSQPTISHILNNKSWRVING